MSDSSAFATVSESYTTTVPLAWFEENDLENQIFTFVSEKGNHDFNFTGVPPDIGQAIFDFLDERIPARKTLDLQNRILRVKIMPTEIHDCHQGWVVKHIVDWVWSGDLTRGEEDQLCSRVGTTLDMKGIHRGSRKEPDLFLRVKGQSLPSLVIETGWSESRRNIDRDMRLLLLGGNNIIKTALIIKWRKVPRTHNPLYTGRPASKDRVSGDREVWMIGRQGIPELQQSETIFPSPSPPDNPRIAIRFCDLFGANLPANRYGNEVLELEIERLRKHATEALRLMNMVPA